MCFREWDDNEKDRKCEEKENEWDNISAYGDKDTDIGRVVREDIDWIGLRLRYLRMIFRISIWKKRDRTNSVTLDLRIIRKNY